MELKSARFVGPRRHRLRRTHLPIFGIAQLDEHWGERFTVCGCDEPADLRIRKIVSVKQFRSCVESRW